MTNDRLPQIAAQLDRLASVPTDVLGELVMRDGACMWAYTHGEAPVLSGIDSVDRELAARLCHGCPVRDECLEFELRTAGAETVGVWGALGEDDRRALHPLWRARRPDIDETAEEGGDAR